MARLRIESVFLKEISLAKLLVETLLKNDACATFIHAIAEDISKEWEDLRDESK